MLEKASIISFQIYHMNISLLTGCESDQKGIYLYNLQLNIFDSGSPVLALLILHDKEAKSRSVRLDTGITFRQ
jgi:hypothetical protein